MKILAIETSCSQGNICLLEDDHIVCEEFLGQGMVHGRELVPCMNSAMRSHGWSPDALDLIAVSKGPGSFTGLRVGLAVAKTLALIDGTPLVGIPTLDVLAQNVPAEESHACPMTDARRKEINACLYKREHGTWSREWEYQTWTAQDLCRRLPKHTCVLGDALDVYADDFASRHDLQRLPPENWFPRAYWVGVLGRERLLDGETDDPRTLTPLYIRLPPVVERLG